ncbi:hypothetical protein HDU83_009328, partial [Entophlyctis luteolus]
DLLTSLPKYGPEFEPKGKLRVVAINSEPTFNKYMCDATVFSAAVNSIPLVIYGAAPYYSHMMKGKDGKIDRMLSVMCAMDPADVVLMVDAYDVIFQRPFAEMEYLYHHKWQSPNFSSRRTQTASHRLRSIARTILFLATLDLQTLYWRHAAHSLLFCS